MSKEYIAPTVEPMGGEDVAPMSTAAAWETFFRRIITWLLAWPRWHLLQ